MMSTQNINNLVYQFSHNNKKSEMMRYDNKPAMLTSASHPDNLPHWFSVRLCASGVSMEGWTKAGLLGSLSWVTDYNIDFCLFWFVFVFTFSPLYSKATYFLTLFKNPLFAKEDTEEL